MVCTGTTLLVLCTSIGLLLLKRRVPSVCVDPSSLVLDVTAGVTSWRRITFCAFMWQYNSVRTLNWCRIPSMGKVRQRSSIGLTAGGVQQWNQVRSTKRLWWWNTNLLLWAQVWNGLFYLTLLCVSHCGNCTLRSPLREVEIRILSFVLFRRISDQRSFFRTSQLSFYRD
jgi:hypothetical protein